MTRGGWLTVRGVANRWLVGERFGVVCVACGCGWVISQQWASASSSTTRLVCVVVCNPGGERCFVEWTINSCPLTGSTSDSGAHIEMDSSHLSQPRHTSFLNRGVSLVGRGAVGSVGREATRPIRAMRLRSRASRVPSGPNPVRLGVNEVPAGRT